MNRISNTRWADRRREWRFSHLHPLLLLALLPLGLACRDGAIADATEETTAETDTGMLVGTPQTVSLAGATAAGCPSSGFTRLVSVSTASQLASALSNAQPGDQIRLAAGTYRGRMTLSRSGKASARITLCGMPGVRPILKGGRFRTDGSWVTITGLVFEGPDGHDGNVFIASGTDVLFSGNEVRFSDWYHGIAVQGTCRLRLVNNYIHDNGSDGTVHSQEVDHGIYFHAQACGGLIANNLVTNGKGRGISIHDASGGGAINNIKVVHNTVVNNGSTGILIAANNGTGNVIANNISANNGRVFNYKQIRIKSGTNKSFIQNNLTWSPNASRSGIELGGTGNTVSRNIIGNPLFVAPYSDLHLRSGSPAIGLALPTYSVSPDYDGITRDGSPSAGAYEK
jgi:Right handed beta helix region